MKLLAVNSLYKLTIISAMVLSVSACGTKEQSKQVIHEGLQSHNIDLWPKGHSPVKDSKADTQFVDELLAKMTVEEKVGQLIQAEIQAITPEQAKKYHIGSILNGGGSVPNRKDNASAEYWATFADDFYLASIDKQGGRTGVPIIWGTDAVHGHGNVVGATLFPHNIGLGAMRNTDLLKKIAQSTAKEVRATGIEWVFAPTLAVARDDRWGRTYESYSENPELVAEYAKAMIYGLQGIPNTDNFLDGEHVAATAKHFLADGGTDAGDDQGDAKISEAQLVAIHNAGYPPAIAAGVQSIMASFSAVNGEKMHGNHYLLTDVLKKRMGFAGFVVGDWNGHGQVPNCTNDACAQAVNAGIDMLMGPYDWKNLYENTLAQVKAKTISQSRLNQAVRDILLVKKRLHLFNGIKPSERQGAADNAVIGAKAHRDIARQAVRESLVLLKNNDQLLPLKPNQTILVAGSHADNIAYQSGGWSVTWQGAGLNNSQFPGATSIFKGIQTQAKLNGSRAILSTDGTYDEKPDVAVVVFGETPYAEGQGDLNSLEFEAGNRHSLTLLKKLKAQGIPVVSVFISGRPLWVNPYINASDAFVAAWLPGSEGLGVAQVLLSDENGQVNYDFKGKLSFSWPKDLSQVTLNIGDEHYDPLFAYGFGLTYQSDSHLGMLKEDVKGVASDQPQDIDLYVGRPLQPWQVKIEGANSDQLLSGAYAELTDGTVKVTTSDKDVQEDALTFSYHDTWLSRLSIKEGKPLNLTPYLVNGAVSFDIRVDDIKDSGLDLVMSCGDDCTSKVRLREWAIEQQGKGWQQLAIPMRCFEQADSDFSGVAQPFTLEAGGKGQFAIANVQFKLAEQGNFSCPNIATLTTTPVILNEYWSQDWWLPRHKDKVARAKQGDIDLLMLGDSITHNWENKEGKAVWQKHFGDINTLNLGFGGDRTENVLWRLEHGEVSGIAPDLAVVMIGTNNTGFRMDNPRYIAQGVERIISELKQRLPSTQILLTAIFPRGQRMDDELRKNNQQVNVLLRDIAKQQDVMFTNFNAAFLTEDGTLSADIMPDYLHPNAQGYEIWADKLTPYIEKYVKHDD